MVIRERRCPKCQSRTGIQPDGTFVDYTFHPFVTKAAGRPVESVAVFCARCFDALGSAAARDLAAAAPPAREREVVQLHA